jgi:hypothetical protein
MTTMTAVHPLRSTPDFGVLAGYYTSEYAWTVAADSAGVWLRLGGVVDALVVGPVLAPKVNAVLERSMLCAPIIEVSGGDWIFLTERRTPLRQSTWDYLAGIPVGWGEPGTYLRLPGTDELARDGRWRRRPVPGAPLPPWTAVVGATRSVAPR